MRAKSDGAKTPKRYAEKFEDGSKRIYKRTKGGLKISSVRHDASKPIKGASGRAKSAGPVRMKR